MTDIRQLTEKIKQFRDQRDWMKFHNHKDMALSLVLEAAEVLEHFQWKNNDEINEYARSHREELSEEIADCAMYIFELADNLGIDLAQAVNDKLKKNAVKYPVEKSKGVATKYTKL